jgi:hypothetical protein
MIRRFIIAAANVLERFCDFMVRRVSRWNALHPTAKPILPDDVAGLLAARRAVQKLRAEVEGKR